MNDKVTTIKNMIGTNFLKNPVPITYLQKIENDLGIIFPEEFKIVVADASAYKQFGNSVAIPAIQATAEKELQILNLI